MPIDTAKFQAASATFPPTVPYKTLLKTHAHFDAVRMAEHEALFEGGKLFDELLKKDNGKFLIKRESEKGSGGSASADQFVRYENPGPAAAASGAISGSASVNIDTYQLRKKYVSYKPRVQGLINFIKASVLSSAPAIVATRKATAKPTGLFDRFLNFFGVPKNSSDDPGVQFYHNLNRDADGRGNSLTQCKAKLLRDLFIHGRYFAGIAFRQTDSKNALEAGKKGAYDASFSYISPLEVDDWEHDASGLKMIRRHCVSMTRSNPTAPPDIKTESWYYLTPAGIFTYSVVWTSNGDGTFTQPLPDAPIARDAGHPNQLNDMPVRMLDLGIHIMELLRPSVIDQINLNADLRWQIQKDVFALVVVCSKRSLNNVDPATQMMQLDPQDTAEILKSGGETCEPIYKALDRNDDEMYESLMALILKSAAQASNGRQSGEAKRMDYNTFETFLLVFSEPIRALLQWQLDTIRAQRPGDDDILVTVQGLDNFDIESVAQILANAKLFLDLPETTDTARKSMVLRAFRAVMGSAATPEQLEAVVKEISVQEPRTSVSGPSPVTEAAK